MKKTQELLIPNSSADITLGMFQDVIALSDEKGTEAVALLAGVTADFLAAMAESDLIKVTQLCMSALYDDKVPIRTTWEHKGIKYRMHPEFTAMTTGEMTDMETYLNHVADFHKGIAVAFRAETKSTNKAGGLYEIVPYTGTALTAEIFRSIPLSTFYGFKGFFLRTGQELKNNLDLSSTQTGTEKTSKDS